MTGGNRPDDMPDQGPTAASEDREVHRLIYLQLIEQNSQLRERLKERTRQLQTARQQRDEARLHVEEITARIEETTAGSGVDVVGKLAELRGWVQGKLKP
ncbi:MAG: hypothetical protein GEU79_18520 [Acidimicrobiia bacterium]|nr:hypothetical protein [Acidimicrobiia bacterium]